MTDIIIFEKCEIQYFLKFFFRDPPGLRFGQRVWGRAGSALDLLKFSFNIKNMGMLINCLLFSSSF